MSIFIRIATDILYARLFPVRGDYPQRGGEESGGGKR